MTIKKDIIRVLDQFTPIQPKKPADLIIEQIRAVVARGFLKPGQRIPAERVLAERLGVGRGPLREAFRKLEMFGIVVPRAPNNFFVAKYESATLVSMIDFVLRQGDPEFDTLMQAREAIEPVLVATIAARIDDGIPEVVRLAREAYRKAVASGGNGEEEDMLFHLKLAEAADNVILSWAVGLFAPEIVRFAREYNLLRGERPAEVAAEHDRILNAIERHDPAAAAAAMRNHLEVERNTFEATLVGEAQFAPGIID